MIDCRETLLRFYEYLDRELPNLEASEVEEHLKACRHCFDRMEFEKHFTQFVRVEGQLKVDSEALKMRLQEKLRALDLSNVSEDDALFPTTAADVKGEGRSSASGNGVRRTERLRVPGWSDALVALALVLLAIPFLRGTPDGTNSSASLPPSLGPLAAIHSSFEPQFRGSEAEPLAQWIRERAPHEPMVRDFARAGCDMLGASVDSIWAVLFARQGSVPISVFVATQADFPIPAGLREITVHGHSFHVAESNGLALVLWEYHPDGLVCAAVARASADRLIQLVLAVEELMMKEAG